MPLVSSIARPLHRPLWRPSSVTSAGSYYPAIAKIALLGDSITGGTSGNDVNGNKVFFASGYGSYLRRRLGSKIALDINSVTGFYHYGINGSQASWFLQGHADENATALSYLAALLASDADTVLVLLEANALTNAGGKTAAQSASNVVALWDIIIAAGKNVIGVAPLPQAADNVDAANFLSRRLECTALLAAAAAARGNRVQFIDVGSALDANGNNFMDPAKIGEIQGFCVWEIT